MLVPILLLLFVIVMIYIGFWFISSFSGAPFIVTPQHRIKVIKKIFEEYKPEKIAELGAGNGTVVIALAEEGYTIHGYEINPFLVWWGKVRLRILSLNDYGQMYQANIWCIDLSDYDGIFIYGIPGMMQSLGEKLQKEVKPDTVIVSSGFKIRQWREAETRGDLHIYRF